MGMECSSNTEEVITHISNNRTMTTTTGVAGPNIYNSSSKMWPIIWGSLRQLSCIVTTITSKASPWSLSMRLSNWLRPFWKLGMRPNSNPRSAFIGIEAPARKAINAGICIVTTLKKCPSAPFSSNLANATSRTLVSLDIRCSESLMPKSTVHITSEASVSSAGQIAHFGMEARNKYVKTTH